MFKRSELCVRSLSYIFLFIPILCETASVLGSINHFAVMLWKLSIMEVDFVSMYLSFSKPFFSVFCFETTFYAFTVPRFSSKKYTAVFCIAKRCSFTMVGYGFTHSEKLFLAKTIRSTILQLSEIIVVLFTSTNAVHAIFNKILNWEKQTKGCRTLGSFWFQNCT